MTTLPLFTAKLSLAEYLGLDGVSWRHLWPLVKPTPVTPAHARRDQLYPKAATARMDFGSLAHAAILEPGRFDERYVCMDAWLRETDAGRHAFEMFRAARVAADHSKRGDLASLDRQTREGKLLHAEFDRANPGRHRVSVEDHSRLRGMIAAVQAHKTASALLYGPGTSEVSIAWQHEGGAVCKARGDRLTHLQWHGVEYLHDVEIKTTEASAAEFEGRTALNMGYHLQAAMRMAGWRAIARAIGQDAPTRFVHVVIETEPLIVDRSGNEAHGVRVVELDERSMAKGAELFERAAKTWAECQRSGEWPAYPDGGPEPVSLPKWALGAPTSSDELE